MASPSSLFTSPVPLLFLLLSLVLISLPAAAGVNPQPPGSSYLRLPSDAGDPGPCAHSSSVPPPPGSCPVKCFRPDPVCGEDGVTYWCGCPDALCAGKWVVRSGYCEIGNGGSAPVSGQALLLLHIVWLIVLGFSVLCGFL